MIKNLLINMILLFLLVAVEARLTTNLNKGWKFRKTTETTWYPANVPSTVHLDLLDNKLIDDPYFGNVCLKLRGQFIGDVLVRIRGLGVLIVIFKQRI